MEYVSNEGAENFHITLLSRKGVIPEADFYYPVPYPPPKYCSPEKLKTLIKQYDGGKESGLLNAAFGLFKDELKHVAPNYTKKMNLEKLTIEEYYNAYFHKRVHRHPFQWADKNLAKARIMEAEKHISPWRFAILRMHEVFSLILFLFLFVLILCFPLCFLFFVIF